MKLIVITTPNFFPGEAESITALFHAGLDTLHLRKPQASQQELEHLLEQLPQAYYPHIVLHEHFSLATRLNMRGIHLNARNPQPPQHFQGHISRSCHSLDEVAAYKHQCNYVFLSPVYNSISKQGYHAAYTAAALQEACQTGIIDQKVIALGGISLDNLTEVHTYGFGGAAFLGDVWQQAVTGFISHFTALKQLADHLI